MLVVWWMLFLAAGVASAVAAVWPWVAIVDQLVQTSGDVLGGTYVVDLAPVAWAVGAWHLLLAAAAVAGAVVIGDVERLQASMQPASTAPSSEALGLVPPAPPRPDLDFVALARGMGVPGERVTAMEEFNVAVARGLDEGMTVEEIKAYVRYIADWRLTQLKLPTVFGCFDNDGARLILNEYAKAYAKEYYDLASDIEHDASLRYGGRVVRVDHALIPGQQRSPLNASFGDPHQAQRPIFVTHREFTLGTVRHEINLARREVHYVGLLTATEAVAFLSFLAIGHEGESM